MAQTLEQDVQEVIPENNQEQWPHRPVICSEFTPTATWLEELLMPGRPSGESRHMSDDPRGQMLHLELLI